MTTIFTKIIEGEIPGTFVWRDEEVVAFMSINPLRPGHTLVVPRMEIDHWIDCPPELRNHLFEVAQTIANAIDKAFGPAKVALLAVGLEVPHLHLHLVPFDYESELHFGNAAASVAREELEEAASAIRYILTSQGATGVSE